MRSFFWLTVAGFIWIQGILFSNNKSVGVVPEWDKLGGLDIIPCPKKINPKKIKFLLVEKGETKAIIVVPDNSGIKIKIASEIINKSIKEKGGKFLKVVKEKELDGKLPEEKNIILLSVKGKSKFLDNLLLRNKLNLHNYPLGKQGYIIHFLKGKKGNQVLLTGLDEQGVLYAAVTFAELIEKKEKKVIVRSVNIIDWPDFKYRMGLIVGRLPDLQSTKRMIDWFLKYKFNLIKVGDLSTRGLLSHYPWLKEINQYARDRGIKLVYSFTWGIGSIEEYKDDPRFKGCLQYRGEFYCWSRDELLNKKIEEYKSFIQKNGVDGMLFHCLDSYDENWPERCDKCRSRFDDDRAAADAHVINLFTKGLRSVNKDLLLIFITCPYGINLNLPGNEKYKKYYRRLSNLIPPDVFLTVTGYNHDTASSWSETVKQPLVRWQNGSTFQWGRFFNSSPCFLKGVYFPEREDIAFLNESVSYFDGDIMQLIGIEYEWNTNAPGALIIESDPNAPIKENGPYKYRAAQRIRNRDIEFNALEFKDTIQPKETCYILLERVCRKLYGVNIAPYMARYLRAGLTGWRDVNVAKKRAKNSKEAREEYLRANKACQILKEAMKNARTPKEISTLKRFFNRSIYPKIFYGLYSLVLKAEESVKNGNITTAQKLISECKESLEKSRKELMREGVYTSNSERWFKPIKEKIKLVEIKIRISRMRNFRKIKKGAIKVAIYNPNEHGGRGFYITIFNCLNKQPDIQADTIDNLKRETLKRYQVLIINSCKKVSEGDDDFRENIRQFVIEDGGNVIFQHDSVGFYRTTSFKESIFPEICGGGEKRKEEVRVKVVEPHPCLGNLKKGKVMEHMYSDHITLKPGPKGKVIVEDIEGNPVVIVGKIGKGKVIFSGMVTLGRDGKEKEDATLIDKILLINGIHWLAGK